MIISVPFASVFAFYLKILKAILILAAKSQMVQSKLPNSVLGKIWKLSDIDKDGFLDDEEFALAMHLINIKIDGHELPTELPPHLIPPKKRNPAQAAAAVSPTNTNNIQENHN